MKVEVKRVTDFNLRDLFGYDAPESIIVQHADCCRRSTAIWVGEADGVIACAIGVIPTGIFSERAYLWMIDTKICQQHPLRFIRWSRRVIAEVLQLYPTLIGLCSCDNVYGRQWLEWLGAKFDPVPVNSSHYGFTIKGRDDLVLYRIDG